jgi:hypothetical protein
MPTIRSSMTRVRMPLIYGIPVGASYSDFKSSVDKKIQDAHESLSFDQAANVMWTGLDPNSPSTYSDRLQAEVLTSRGLHLAVKSATETDIAVVVSCVPQGNDPQQAAVNWSPAALPGAIFPSTVTQGSALIVVPRPNAQRTLAVNYPGFQASVVLEPYPVPPHELASTPPPSFHWKLVRIDDCESQDFDCSEGAQPIPQNVIKPYSIMQQYAGVAVETPCGQILRHATGKLTGALINYKLWTSVIFSWQGAQRRYVGMRRRMKKAGLKRPPSAQMARRPHACLKPARKSS